MVFSGMPRLRVMAETATASVGETTAASAKATVSGMPGTSQWISQPSPTTVNSTRPSARRRMGRYSEKNSRLGMRQPSANSSGGMNSSRNSSGSKAMCRPFCGQAISAPRAICISGSGMART